MSFRVTRSWTDPRDGREWRIVQRRNEENRREQPLVKPLRNYLEFHCGSESYEVGQRVGGHIDDFSDADLQEILDWARLADRH